MKREYNSPEMEIMCLAMDDIVTNSTEIVPETNSLNDINRLNGMWQ